MKGIVIRSTGSAATVKAEDGRRIECKVKGIFKNKGLRTTNPLAVGDNVVIEPVTGGEYYVISEIEDRHNYIIRRSINLSKEAHILAANIDQALVIVTLHSPRTSFGFIDRVLITCEAYHIPAKIIVNKADLYDNDKSLDIAANLKEVYEKAGYDILFVSALENLNLDILKELMKGKINLLTGHSGSGKSSLVNAIAPDFKLRTGEISAAHLKGMHTTTFAELFEIDEDTYIIDTPGIKEFGIVDMDKSEVRNYFPEFQKFAAQCKFADCMHVNEPDCAVKTAAENNEIAPQRYDSYLGLLVSEEITKDPWK
jgi:ribosome biogenesis GTPase